MVMMKIAYDLAEWVEMGLKLPISISLPKKDAHLLIAGKSGSGKSLSCQYFMRQALKDAESQIFVADYKAGEEYAMLEGCPSYASGDTAVDMITDFYDFFQVLREKRRCPELHYTLFVEEYFGLLNFIEIKHGKKERTDLMQKVGELLAVSRGYNLGVWIAVQRADASLFAAGARDNFQIIVALGRLSKEQKGMLFSGEDIPGRNYPPGQGIVLIDGQGEPREIIVPEIKNSNVMRCAIRQALDAQPTLSSLAHAAAEGQSV